MFVWFHVIILSVSWWISSSVNTDVSASRPAKHQRRWNIYLKCICLCSNSESLWMLAQLDKHFFPPALAPPLIFPLILTLQRSFSFLFLTSGRKIWKLKDETKSDGALETAQGRTSVNRLITITVKNPHVEHRIKPEGSWHRNTAGTEVKDTFLLVLISSPMS